MGAATTSLALLILLACCSVGCEPAESTRARYYWGAEVNVVCPCETGQCYWVRAEPAVLKPLQSFVQRNAERPYQPVLIEFRGQLLDEAAVGFGANYDGLLRIDAVESLTADVPADCAEP